MKWALEIKRFHVSLRQRQLRNVQISVMHVQICFVNINLLLFMALSLLLPSPSSLLKLPVPEILVPWKRDVTLLLSIWRVPFKC